MAFKMKMAVEDWIALPIILLGLGALIYNCIPLLVLAFVLFFLLAHFVMVKGMGPWVIMMDLMLLAMLVGAFALIVAVRNLF